MVAELSPESSGTIDLIIDFLTPVIYKHARPTRHQIGQMRKRCMGVVNNFLVRGLSTKTTWMDSRHGPLSTWPSTDGIKARIESSGQ